LPAAANSSVGSKARTTPVNEWSNSWRVTVYGPIAGSLTCTLPRRKPSTTTKWLKFQCTMTGIVIAPTSSGSFR
jgi:hypothetical protein